MLSMIDATDWIGDALTCFPPVLLVLLELPVDRVRQGLAPTHASLGRKVLCSGGSIGSDQLTTSYPPYTLHRERLTAMPRGRLVQVPLALPTCWCMPAGRSCFCRYQGWFPRPPHHQLFARPAHPTCCVSKHGREAQRSTRCARQHADFQLLPI